MDRIAFMNGFHKKNFMQLSVVERGIVVLL